MERKAVTGHGFALVVALGLAGACTGQNPLWDHVSAPPLSNQFGIKVWTLSDVDGDQVADLLVGGAQVAQYVGILSGATGNTIAEYFSQAALRPLGTVGDVTGDGMIDFLIVQFPPGGCCGVLSLVSGATGAILGTNVWGAADLCAPIGDINGDGLGDFATATFGQGVFVYHGPGFNFAYGIGVTAQSIAPCGDVNQDGLDDFIVGAPGASLYGFPITVPGSAYVMSGLDGSVIYSWTGPFVGSKFGAAVVSPGDMDMDGIPDIVVSAPGAGAAGLYGYPGATGAQIGYYVDPLGWSDWFGVLLVAAGDVDGDGVGDFVAKGHYVDVFSGATLTPISMIQTNLQTTYPNGYNVASALAVLPDMNGDTFPEVVIGAPAISSQPSGHIQCYTLRPIGVGVAGSGCPQSSGVVARIGATGVPTSNTSFNLNLSKVPPGMSAGLIVGLSNTQFGSVSLPWQVDPVLAPGCFLYEAIDLFPTTTTTPLSPGSGSGRAIMPLGIPPGVAGLTFYAQWGVSNPPGSMALGSLTRSLTVTVQ